MVYDNSLISISWNLRNGNFYFIFTIGIEVKILESGPKCSFLYCLKHVKVIKTSVNFIKTYFHYFLNGHCFNGTVCLSKLCFASSSFCCLLDVGYCSTGHMGPIRSWWKKYTCVFPNTTLVILYDEKKFHKQFA